jgi:citrate lyase subunit beta/citryl-CoA lyase
LNNVVPNDAAQLMHPSKALFQDQAMPRLLPVCDHYAGSEKLMRKAMALQVEYAEKTFNNIATFDITFDCEDGASIGNEADHANLVADLICSPENHFNRIGVRVHDLQHPHLLADLQIILSKASKQLAYLVLPKVNSAIEVIQTIKTINDISAPHTTHLIPIHVLIEGQAALADVKNIAAISQVECLSFGIMDYVSSFYGAIPGLAMQSPAQFSHPLLHKAKVDIASACHLYGKTPSHNVCTNFKDEDIVKSDALKAKMEFAFTRMWSIHPKQIPIILNAFAPQQTEVEIAIEILEKAQAQHWGPIQHQGYLHDRASYRYYWSVLQRAHRSGMQLSPAALELI